MNKVYKVIWNRARHCYVVVSELTKRAGKEKSTHLTKASRLAVMAICTSVLSLGVAGIQSAAAAGQPTVAETTQNQYVAFLVTVSSGSVTGNDNGKDTNTFNGATYHKVTLSDGKTKYWVRDGYTLTEGTNEKYTTLSRSDKRFDVAFTGSGKQPEDILTNTTSAVSSTGVSTNVGESLNQVSASAFEGLSQAGGTQVPGNWDYIIYDPSWEGHTQSNTSTRTYYKDGYADMYNSSAGTNGNPRGFVSVGTDLVWNGTLNQYTYKGTAVDPSHLYVIGGKIGVFTSYDGSKVYEGTVYGANNEILMTAMKDGRYYSYWAAPVTDPSATMATYRVSDYNKDLETLKDNDVALYHNDIKSVDMAKGGTTTAPTATITPMRNGNGTAEAVDGAITVTGGGGTNGQDTSVTLSNTTNGATVSQTFATGSKVVANTAATGSSELKSLSINGQDYATALKFGGDNHGTTTLTRNLSEELDILGGADSTKLTDGNIGVNAADGTLKVQLAKDVNLTDAGSLMVGNTQVNTNGVTVAHTGSDGTSQTLNAGYQSFTYDYMKPVTENGTLKLESAIANAEGLFVTGLSNRTWTPGNYVTGRAATEDQLEQAGRHFLSIGTTVAENTLANYYNDGATGTNSMAFGVGTKSKGNFATSMGINSTASGLGALAVGYDNIASGTDSVSVGTENKAAGNFSVALGVFANAGTANTDTNSTTNGAAVAVGFQASAAKTGSSAYGYNARAVQDEGTALGVSSVANVEGGVAVGAHSIADVAKGAKGYLAGDSDASTTWVSTAGAMSLGGNTKDENGNAITVSRQITNLAAGTNDTDAVNVAQLKAVESEGLNFQGNNTDTTVHINQGGTLQVQGTGTKAATEYSGENILVTGVNETADDGKTVTTKLNIGLDKNIRVDSVTAGQATTDSVQGYVGSVKIVGPSADSTKYEATSLTTAYDTTAQAVNDATINRLQYTDGNGITKHTVATLEDGLKLAGDAGTGTVKLDSTLSVTGGENSSANLASGNNIGVTASDGALKLQLAKNLTGLNSVKAGNVVVGSQADGADATKTGNYITGLDNRTWTVGTTKAVSGRAATENQLQSVADVVNTNRSDIATNKTDIAKGLNFSTNTTDASSTTGYKVVNKALGDTVSIKAHDAQSGHTYKTDNLTTSIDNSGNITIAMDTQLTADKVTVGTGNNALTLDGSNGILTTGSSTLNGTGLSITGGPSLTTSGISGGSKQITKVASGASGVDTAGKAVYGTTDNAANIGDVKTIAAQMVTVSKDSTKNNTKIKKTTNDDGTVDYEVALNDTLTLGDNNYAVLNGNAGTLSLGTLLFMDGINGYGTIGSLHLGNYTGTDSSWSLTDNKNGTVAAGTYLTGLTNTSWTTTDPTYVSGRAATEDELAAVSSTMNTGWEAQVDGTKLKAVTPSSNTLNFATGDNIKLTGSGSTITIATQPDVQFNTVAVKGKDGTYTGGINIGVQAGGGVNGSATDTIASITGLKNTEWTTGKYMSGRAATEDQLNTVAQQIKGEVSASDIYATGASVSYADNGTGTGTLNMSNPDKTGTITGLHDFYVKSGVVSDDGKTMTLTRNGGPDNNSTVTVDLTPVYNNDDHLVASDAADGAYVVDADGKVTLHVTNAADENTGKDPTNIVISGLASKAELDQLDQGLSFTASALADDATSLTHTAQLGDSIGILGGNKQDGHTYNTNNITTTISDKGDIRVLLDDNLTATSLTAGSKTTDDATGVDGIVKATGQGGAYLQLNGADGSLRMGDSSGNFAAMVQNYGGPKFLDSTAAGSPRIQYWAANANQTEAEASKTLYTLATLNDGLQLAGDSGTGSVALDNILTVTGGVTAASDLASGSNIGVTASGSTLQLQLAKNLTGLTSIALGNNMVLGNQTSGSATGDYLTGLDNTTWSGTPVSGRAATEDQLKLVSDSLSDGTKSTGGFGLTADVADSTTSSKDVKQSLGQTIKITAEDDDNLTTTADATNTAIKLALSKNLKLTSATYTDATGNNTKVTGTGITIAKAGSNDAGKVSLTTAGLDNGGNQIVDVASGLGGIELAKATGDILNHAATIGDLQAAAKGVTDSSDTKGLNFVGNSNPVDSTTGNTMALHANLGGTVSILGTGTDVDDNYSGRNVKVINKNNALYVELDKDLEARSMQVGYGESGNDVQGQLLLYGPNSDNTYSNLIVESQYMDGKPYLTNTTTNGNKRLVYKNGENDDVHTVATMSDGLKFSDDNGSTAAVTLGSTLAVTGGASNDKLAKDTNGNLVTGNIGVIAGENSDGTSGSLTLALAKDVDLGAQGSLTANGAVLGYQTATTKVGQVNETGNYVTGLTNTTWSDTDYVSGRAATEDQLKQVNDSITQVLGNGKFAITAGGRVEAVDATIEQNLGSAIRIFGDAPVTNEKDDGSGDYWDRSKANILTKVKKDHFGKEYVSVELQDHLEVGVHGGIGVEGTDGSMQLKGATAKEVNITGDTGITLSDNGNQAAALRQADGAGYLDLTGTKAGTKATVSVYTGAKNLAQQDQTRLIYSDQGDKAHDVATLDDGLIFAGDTGDNVSRTLNGTLKISGGVTDVTSLSTGSNIGVVASTDGLQLKLAKNLTGIESVTGLTNTTLDVAGFGTSHRAATEEQLKAAMSSITNASDTGGFGLTADNANTSGKSDVKQNLGGTIGIHGDSNITTSVSEDGHSINIGLKKNVDLGDDGSIKAGGVTINNSGIDAGSKNITNVKSGIVNGDDRDNTNAANIGDVKKLAGDAAKGAVDSLGKREFAGDDGETVSRGLGESMKLAGGADTAKLTDANIGVVKNAAGDGLDIKLSSELKGLTSVNTGNSTLNGEGLTINNSDGQAGTTITGSGIKIAAGGEGTHAVEISNSNVSMGGQQIHDVAPGTAATDAVNVSQLSMFADNVGGAINKLDNRVNRVGAGAAALAALHPLDFDPDDKWDFAGGFGHYKNANAAAIGAYYRPNEDTMFSIGGSFGGGENMFNAGVSFKLGQGNHVSTSRTMMAKEIESLKAVVKEQNEKLQENNDLRAKVEKQDKEIAELKAMVQQLAARR
ncbi:MAG: YadA-like family protein [Megasphaera elsdenii]|nr:YadA-like family protein [Megasphaera elsdenii]